MGGKDMPMRGDHMRIRSTVSPDQKRLDISVVGEFNFSLYRDFRDAYQNCENIREYNVNLGGINYVDSSGLGMLLALREHAQAHNGQVVLKDPSPAVRKVLVTANFQKIFTIE
jgi:anti-anti-sigma factor